MFSRLPPLSDLALSAVTPIFRGKRRFHACPTRSENPSRRYPRINVDSLSDTLEDHRAANRPPSLITKYPRREGAETSQSQNDGMPKTLADLPRLDNNNKRSWAGASSKQRSKRELRELRRAARTKERTAPDLKSLSWTSNRRKGETRQCPWLDHVNGPSSSGLSRLHEEIDAYERYMAEIPQETAAAAKAQQQVSQVLSQAGLSSPVVFGSRQTGMALRHSDMELLIPVEATNFHVWKEEASHNLSRVFHAFQTSDEFAHASYIGSHVPRVHTGHKASALTISIHSGGTRLHSSSEYVRDYATEFPALRRLFTVLRMILETRGHFGASRDGVAPYGLVMMIVAALKLGEGTYDRHYEVGRQLLHVLRFYADADFSEYGISVDPPGIFRKTEPPSLSGPLALTSTHARGQAFIGKRSKAARYAILCLQDPADYMNDLGTRCFKTRLIQRIFRQVHDDIQAGILAWDEKEEVTDDNRPQQEVAEVADEDDDAARTVDLDDEESEGESYTATAELIRQSDDKQAVGLLQLALGANYNSLEELRDRTVRGLDG